MTVSGENAIPRPLEGSRRDVPARELAVVALFGPLANAVAAALLPLRVPPSAVVLANTAAGLLAAVAIGFEALVVAALLLQLKTVLDNADGRLARASGRVSLLGRYLDTEADFVVNAMLFVALGALTGEPWLAFAAFVALTLTLTVDFNLVALYRETHLDPAPPPPATGSPVERTLERAYSIVFEPQDRLVRALSERRLERLLRDEHDPARSREAKRAYQDRGSLAVLANLGLSTQLLALGVCLLFGAPVLYLWLASRASPRSSAPPASTRAARPPGASPVSAGPVSRGGALVTGSAKGIGRTIALALARDGYDVAIHYLTSAEEAERTREEAEAVGVRAVSLTADVTDRDAATALVEEAHRELGGLSVLVNNVGNYVHTPLDELTFEEWDDVLATNLEATFTTCRAAVPLLGQGGGRIVNLGYAGAQNLVARPNIAAYAIAKTGVTLLTKAIARAEAANGITANVVAPGVIESSRTKPLREIPMGRPGTVEEVAAAVCYFASPEAEYVTGQVLEVAGGWNL